jgi:glutamate dehydrogenase (NADP+)
MLATQGQDLKGKTVAIKRFRQCRTVCRGEGVKPAWRPKPSPCAIPSPPSLTRRESVKTSIDFIMELKNIRRGRIQEYADKYNTMCFIGNNVWDVIREQE